MRIAAFCFWQQCSPMQSSKCKFFLSGCSNYPLSIIYISERGDTMIILIITAIVFYALARSIASLEKAGEGAC